jgi:hypothetical protein
MHKVMGLQIYKNLNSKNLGLPLWNPRTKWHLDVSPMGRHREYYKDEGDGFPQVGVVVSLVSSCCPRFIHAPKALQLHTNQLVLWFVQVHVNNWFALSLFLVPSQNFNTPLYPQMLWAKECAPTLSPSVVFIFGLIVESIKELGGASLWMSSISFVFLLLTLTKQITCFLFR